MQAVAACRVLRPIRDRVVFVLGCPPTFAWRPARWDGHAPPDRAGLRRRAGGRRFLPVTCDL